MLRAFDEFELEVIVDKLTSWQFPKNAQHADESVILFTICHSYMIFFLFIITVTCFKLNFSNNFKAGMVCFTAFTWWHAIGHITELWWTYLPVHYTFVAGGLFMGMNFGGIKPNNIPMILMLDYMMINNVGQIFGVLSAFTIMCFGLRNSLQLSFILFLGCGLIFCGIVYNDVFHYEMHHWTEVCACTGLSFGGAALFLAEYQKTRENNKSLENEALQRHMLTMDVVSSLFM
jgi:hypothetical protein